MKKQPPSRSYVARKSRGMPQVNFIIPADVVAILTIYAEQTEQSRSSVVTQALRMFLGLKPHE